MCFVFFNLQNYEIFLTFPNTLSYKLRFNKNLTYFMSNLFGNINYFLYICIVNLD